MLKFKILKSGETKTAFAFREDGEKIYIKFTSEGKEYGYFKNNIELICSDKSALPFCIYSFMKECYKCHKPTEVITYITYTDQPTEDVIFPWDLRRLLKHQDIIAHLHDSSIEYYGLNVIGDIEEFDYMLMEKYPDRIQKI